MEKEEYAREGISSMPITFNDNQSLLVRVLFGGIDHDSFLIWAFVFDIGFIYGIFRNT